MRKTVSMLVVLLAFSLLPLAVGRAQDRDDTAKPKPTKTVKKDKKEKKDNDRDQTSTKTDQDKDKDKDKDRENDKDRRRRTPTDRLVKGPVIEYVGPSDAVIAWTTTEKSSTVLRYGTSPGALEHKAEHPWGDTNHRVKLTNLKPNTTYYFEVGSAQALGSGSAVQSGTQSFHTPPKGGKGEHYPKAGPGL